MPDFDFDFDSPPAQNIESFLDDLESREPELTPLLRMALEVVLPLPPPGQDRNSKRQRANELVARHLDSPEPPDDMQEAQ